MPLFYGVLFCFSLSFSSCLFFVLRGRRQPNVASCMGLSFLPVFSLLSPLPFGAIPVIRFCCSATKANHWNRANTEHR